MPFLQPDSPFATPAPYCPQHVPTARKPRPKVDKTKAHDKARKATLAAKRASLACFREAPHCANALARMAGKVSGADFAPGIMEELAAMPEGLAFALSAWAAPRCRRTWVDADGMRRSAPATPYSELPSALPRVVWHLATSPRQAPKPLAGTHGKARRRSNWTAEGHVIRLDVLLRGALSNLRNQDRRNGGETCPTVASAETASQTAAIEAARKLAERDRSTPSEIRAGFRARRAAMLASVSPALLPTLLASMADHGPMSGSARNILCEVRTRARQLVTAD